MAKNNSGGTGSGKDVDQESTNKGRPVKRRGKLRLLTIAGARPVTKAEVVGVADTAFGDDTAPRVKAYDLNEFNIPASDGRGLKERRWVELQPGYVNQMGAILATKNFPYRSEQSLIRHAIHRHLRYLLSLEPQSPNHISVLEVINRIVATQEMMLEVSDLIGRVERTVHELVQRGMKSEAVRMVYDLRRKVEAMHEDRDGVWRAKLLSDIEQRFGHLLKGERVSLIPHEEEA